MRLIYLTCTLLTLHLAQGQLSDDFSDGDFTTNPTWSGNTDKFTIDNGQLRSNSGISNDIFYLSTPNTMCTDVEWRFTVHMKLNTSSANYTDFALMTDNANPNIANFGYFIRVGNTKDEIALYRMETGGPILLLDGTNDQTENSEIAVKVTRDATGLWTIYADYTGGDLYASEGSVLDNTYTTCSHFAIQVRQSSMSFFNDHYFDDIYVGPIIVDTEKPKILSAAAPNDSTIIVQANEPVDTFNTVFSLNNGYGIPQKIIVDGSQLTLTYATPFTNNNYELTISNLSDLTSNLLDTVVLFDYFVAANPKANEILITEIFADPTPPIGLSDAEYIELYNAGTEALELENCTFSDGGTPATFPKKTLAAGAYLIVTKTGNESLFTSYGDVIGLDGFPALNNGGDNLVLTNSDGLYLDQVNYTDESYQDDIKKQGGYALERIDLVTQCTEADNWMASTDASGGTPGTANSVLGANPDQDAPEVLSALISSANEIILTLTENPVGAAISDVTNYTLSGGINPISITPNTIANAITLNFYDPLEQKTEYALTISELSDCKGNIRLDIGVNLVISEPAGAQDILLNEVLFNPKDDGVDFIEMYNNSEKYIEPSVLFIRYISTSGTMTIKRLFISEIMYPHTYLALTSDTAKLQSQYPKTMNLRELESFISISNDGGSLAIFDMLGNTIDSIKFSEDQHFELLKSVDGVSLERVSFSGSSISPSNWQSASASVGYATPGYQNSQYIDLSPSTANYTLVSKSVSPDNDGYEDLLTLRYTTEEPETVLNGYVYNLAGTLVHHPFNNETLGSTGVISWDGVTDNGSKAPIGNYILLLESFTLDGKVTKKKLAFSVAGRF
jgi:hypothetical protein